MKKLIAVILLAWTLPIVAQEQVTYDSEKEKLYKRLTAREIGPVYAAEVDRFYNSTCDSLVKADVRIENEPIKSVLTKYFQACQIELNKQTVTALRMPNLNHSFLEFLASYKREPMANLFRYIGINRTRIFATTFRGTPAGDTLQSYVDIRECMYSPVLIPGRIGKPQFASFRDTMLHYLANTEPELYISELKSNPLLQDLTIRTKNKTVKAVAALQNEESLVELLPFGLAIQEGRTTVEAVKKLIDKPAVYYSAFNKELLELHNSDDQQRRNYLTSFIEDLNHVLCEYYVAPINELHEKPDNVRYRILNGISSTDLYFSILGGESMFYTSSFIHVFNQFLKQTEKEGLDKFFERTGYYHFGDFLTIVSGYGLINKLVTKMNEEKFAEVLMRYTKKHINTTLADKELILHGMSLAEVFDGVKTNTKLRDILMAKLDQVRENEPQYDVLLRRMYAGFKDVLADIDNSKLKEVEKLYEVLPVERLKFKDTIVQVALFYDDVDGTASYGNFMQMFPESKWQKEDKGNYLIIRSKEGTPMLVFCNKPNTKVKDNNAQNEMLQAVADANLEITTFLHRGHSYHLYKSLRKLPPTAQLVYLGSCGGYNDVSKVFHANPDAHIISTRSIGSKYVNDPILNKINSEVLSDRNLEWNELWKGLETSFTNKSTKDLFASYIPPNKYIGIMFIREVFNF